MKIKKNINILLVIGLFFVFNSCRQVPKSGGYVVRKEITRIDSSFGQRMAQSQRRTGRNRIPTLFNVSTTTDGRALFFVGAITVKNRNLTIDVWDNGAEDGDVVSVYVNNSPVLSNFTLKKSKHRFQASVSPGEGQLYLYAHNLGRIPPNTAAIEIWDGNQKHYVYLSSNLQSSQGIKINLK